MEFLFEHHDSSQPDLSLQDMIECDIRAEIEELNKGMNPDVLDEILRNGNLSTLDDHYFNDDKTNSTEYYSALWSSTSSLHDSHLGDSETNSPRHLSGIGLRDDSQSPDLLVNPLTVMPTTLTEDRLLASEPVKNIVGGGHQRTESRVSTHPPLLQFISLPPARSQVLSSFQLQPCAQNTNYRTIHQIQNVQNHSIKEKVFPKPIYSYSCLIALALKNSIHGHLPVSEIYSFMTHNFPYFKTAPDGWKNSVRHNLSLNKCFAKVESPTANNHGNARKGCLWGLNPDKIQKMEEEICKWRRKDPLAIKRSMAKPEDLDKIVRGLKGTPSEPKDAVTVNNDKNVVVSCEDILGGDTLLMSSQNGLWYNDDIDISSPFKETHSNTTVFLSKLGDSSSSPLTTVDSLHCDQVSPMFYTSPTRHIIKAQT